MRHLFRTGFIIAAILSVCVWAFMPPHEKLRRGKDLAGGVSMVYSVRMSPGDDSKEVLARMIEALKKRVDPDGLLEITMVAQGNDRIEITMPLPRAEVKARRKQFEDALAELGRARLTDARLEAALRAPAGEREKRLDALSAGSARRRDLLAQAARAYDAASAARASYQSAPDEASRDALIDQVADAEAALRLAKQDALKTSLDTSEIVKVVQSSTRQRTVEDTNTGERVKLPSPRELAERQLYQRHPDSKDEIDRLLGLHSEYSKVRTTLDDPQDLIRMLRGAGVLSFRIAARAGEHSDEQRLREELRAGGPRNVKSSDARWYKINQIETWLDTKAQADLLAEDPSAVAQILGRGGSGYVAEHYAGDYYLLCYDVRGSRLTQAEGAWEVASARPSSDERGKPCIAFEMSASGATKLGNLTRAHIGAPMAVLLDDEVYTAPTLQSEISARGQITGDFPRSEIEYIVRVLSGGSLKAKLSPEPISIASIGPELGADNLRKGFNSGVISAIIVAVFMVAYYFLFGGVAVVALVANAACILGAMALSQAAFTMPGIAGVILTFGMAVDSNVLVFERMREEFQRGADMKTAVRLGFDKALSAIVDGNVTNLIVCVVLYYTGTPEIKGFAITMGVGVVSTLFAALIVSRFVFEVMIALGWRRGSMLPMAVPRLQSWLTPSIDWLKYRYVFFLISTIIVALGLGMAFFQGRKMLDIEFIGGTQITLAFKDDPSSASGSRIMLERSEVEKRVQKLGEGLPPGDLLSKFASAEIYPVDPQPDGVTSDRFIIRTTAQSQDTGSILRPVIEAFSDVLSTRPKLVFTGSDEATARTAPVYAVDKPTLGANLNRSGLTQDVSAYIGGAAIVLEGLDPAPTLSDLTERLETARQSAEFSDTLARKREIIILDGDESGVRSAVLLVVDEDASLLENEQAWEAQVRDREWLLAAEALTKESTPASVHSFSPAIAGTFRANATVATILSFLLIGVYIWVRFKTPRYSIAAVVALVHDVLAVIGLVALAEILTTHPSTQEFALSMKLLPFKLDLNLVAALLTIAGYSLNDTVVIMDRIRENRGKLPHATREIINTSINQTFSRTLITGGTTLFSCLVLYLIGGEGMRAFAFALMTGLIVGTYSSVAVAAPIVWSKAREDEVHAQAANA